LFAHGTLVGVPGRLVVMRIGHQPSTNPQQRERGDLHVRHLRFDVLLVASYVAVVLFVHVQELDQTIVDEVLEAPDPLLQLDDVLLGHQRASLLDDDVGSAETTSVGTDVNATMKKTRVDGDVRGDIAGASEGSERAQQSLVVTDGTQDVAVQHHEEIVRGVDGRTRRHVDVDDARVVDKADQGVLVHFGGDVCHQGQVLHQTTSLEKDANVYVNTWY
jgi:hypothetical protein